MTLALYTATYVALATAGLILLRRSLPGAGPAELLATPSFYVGAVCYASSFLTFLLSLRRFEVLTVFPVFTGLVYASVSITAVVFLGEKLDLTRLIGIGLVGVGVLLLVR